MGKRKGIWTIGGMWKGVLARGGLKKLIRMTKRASDDGGELVPKDDDGSE